MRIITVVFDVDNTKLWTRMAKIFLESVRRHMPDIDFTAHIISKPENITGKAINCTYNHEKLKIWNEYQQESRCDTIFMDSDMICMQGFQDAFKPDFDIALTVNRKTDHPPLNAGIVFAKPTDNTKAFFRQWVKLDSVMYSDTDLHSTWAAKYLGQNQASLGCLLERKEYQAKILYRENRVWNCTDTHWHTLNDETIFVHLKGVLRTELLNNVVPHPPYAKVMKMWYDMDAELNGVDHSSYVNRAYPARAAKQRGNSKA